MKRVGKAWFFVFVLIIAFLTYTAFFGISTQYGDTRTVIIKGALNEGYENDGIRWGTDIRGGVDVTFRTEETEEGSGVYVDATDEEIQAAANVIENRLVLNNITDYEVYTDVENDRIIVRYPWKEGEDSGDISEAIQELGSTAQLTFKPGSADYTQETILDGTDVEDAQMGYSNEQGYSVNLTLSSEGAQKFATATQENINKPISIFLDEECISTAIVNEAITDGNASISGDFTSEEATQLANLIKSGSMPIKMETDTFGSINPTLGDQAKEIMLTAGLIGLCLVILFMIIVYRLPGVIASIAVIGQLACTVAAITGYFGGFNSFTLTLPGMAGITSERIKEEIRAGRTIDGAIQAGNKGSFWAIFDGNITTIIVAVILMGVFGPPDSFFATILKPFMFMFGASATGAVYSFGYTLLVGVILNFVMGVFASRVMLNSISRFKIFRKPWLYGGASK